MTEFGEPEFTVDATTFDHRDIGSLKYSFDHQGFLLTLFKRCCIHEGGVDIARPVLREHDKQEECFHIRDYFARDWGWSVVPGLWSLIERLTTKII